MFQTIRYLILLVLVFKKHTSELLTVLMVVQLNSYDVKETSFITCIINFFECDIYALVNYEFENTFPNKTVFRVISSLSLSLLNRPTLRLRWHGFCF